MTSPLRYHDESLYCDSDVAKYYDSWEEFLESWKDIRHSTTIICWRWEKVENGDNESDEQLVLGSISEHHGIFCELVIENMHAIDEEVVRMFLEKQWKGIKKLWKPILQKDTTV